MKTEERKIEDCELLDKYRKFTKEKNRTNSVVNMNQFKADNDLLLKPKLVSGWYLDNIYNNKMLYFDFEKNINYGIVQDGTWLEKGACTAKGLFEDTLYTLATEAKILERLSAMAFKMGYVKRGNIESLYFKGETSGLYVNHLPMINEDGFWYMGCVVMKEGKWAEIISTPKLELSKEEWYECIGIDKHIEAITKQGYVVTLEKK
jgi:hypothetical protein